MSFPEWGYSYNALFVPLNDGWHCALLSVRELPTVDRGWFLSFEERKRKKKERDAQIEQDRQDFDRLFRVCINRREARSSFEFREYVAFIENNVRASGWDLLDGEGVTNVLHRAVREGLIIPAIDRGWQGGRRVFRQYAPQRWQRQDIGHALRMELANVPDRRKSAAVRIGGTLDSTRKTSIAVSSFGGVASAISHSAVGGSPLVSDSVSSLDNAFSNLSRQGLSTVIAALGKIFSEENGFSASAFGTDSVAKSFGDPSDGDSLPGDAQPFEYQADMSNGEIDSLAGMPIKGGPANTWVANPSGSGQLRLYDASGNAAADIDFDHDHGFGAPHSHNWDGKDRDLGNPVSILPF